MQSLKQSLWKQSDREKACTCSKEKIVEQMHIKKMERTHKADTWKSWPWNADVVKKSL